MFKKLFEVLTSINKKELAIAILVNLVIGSACLAIFSHGWIEAVTVSILTTIAAFMITAIFKVLNKVKPVASSTTSFIINAGKAS